MGGQCERKTSTTVTRLRDRNSGGKQHACMHDVQVILRVTHLLDTANLLRSVLALLNLLSRLLHLVRQSILMAGKIRTARIYS